MARGWESKSVEEQQSEARAASTTRKRPRSAGEIARDKQQDSLKLSRSRIVQQLGATQNPSYRQMLEAALADLDRQLSSQNDAEA